MLKKEAKERIDHLKKVINKYRYERLVLNKELISPEAEDSLKKELFDLENQYPEFITPDSPTQRVGGKVQTAFKKVHHETPMLSFNDAFSEDDVRQWLERGLNYLGEKIRKQPLFYCELKIDGLAIELVYENGVLKEGSTRGDATTGEDITENLKTIEAIPLIIEPLTLTTRIPRLLVVRGEVFITKDEFERVNREQKEKSGKLFANPRNMAAGSMRQLDPKITASRKLDSFAYDIASSSEAFLSSEALAKEGVKTHEEIHRTLKDLGFKTNPNNKSAKSLEEVFEFRNYWEKHREKLPYEIDGIVVVINDNETFKRAGVVGKAPRAAVAYKFPPKETTTVVLDIKIQVGRTGVLTPVAVLRPVEVGGVRISHATLHNFDQIRRLGLKIGDTVIVSRAGDVIPQVTKVLENLRTGREKDYKIPSRCPIDGSEIEKDGAVYRCSNPNCGARLRESLYHFVSREAFDLRGLGPKIIDKFIDEGFILDAADIFLLDKDEIASLPGFGDKSAENIIKEVLAKKKISLPRLIYALGILHIGEEMAYLLAERSGMKKRPIRRPRDLLKTLGRLSKEELMNVSGIGPKVAQSIYEWFRGKRNIKLLNKLEQVGVRIESLPRVSLRDEKLKDKIFVLTGTLELMTREEAKRRIRELGGDVSESVSRKTDYLVCGSQPGSKLNRARKLGVKTISEQEFRSLLER